MSQVSRYILRQLLLSLAGVAFTLTCVVWLTQSLRYIELIINRGLSVSLFVYLTILLLPAFFGIRPCSVSARRRRNSIWALVLRRSSAAQRARASCTAGSNRRRIFLRSDRGAGSVAMWPFLYW